jgi:predicted DNA-binding helix-hairpin-helix protein
VDTILATRRLRRLALHDLTAMRVPLARALPFVVAADHAPRQRGSVVIPVPGFRRRAKQLELFDHIAERPA